jgi:hypothetical protein
MEIMSLQKNALNCRNVKLKSLQQKTGLLLLTSTPFYEVTLILLILFEHETPVRYQP